MQPNLSPYCHSPVTDELGRDFRTLARAEVLSQIVQVREATRTANLDALQFQKVFASATQIAWHYTKGTSFIDIMASGQLLPAYTTVSKTPVVWFSLDQVWEPTSQVVELPDDDPPVWLGKAMTHDVYGGLLRFGYPAGSLRTWGEGKKLAKFKREWIKSIETEAAREGATPALWMVALERLPVTDLMIEYWDGSRWNCIQDPSAGESWVWLTNMKEAA